VSLFGNEILIVSVNTKIKWYHKLLNVLLYIYIYIYIYLYIFIYLFISTAET